MDQAAERAAGLDQELCRTIHVAQPLAHSGNHERRQRSKFGSKLPTRLHEEREHFIIPSLDDGG